MSRCLECGRQCSEIPTHAAKAEGGGLAAGRMMGSSTALQPGDAQKPSSRPQPQYWIRSPDSWGCNIDPALGHGLTP